ncbi:MAG: sugar transferase [Ferruginibacter sp.]
MNPFIHITGKSTEIDFAEESCDRTLSYSKKKKYLFITDSITHKSYQHIIQSSFNAPSFEEAKDLLLREELLPDMIVLDLPLQHLELIEFKVWLTSNELNNIPIIYNETALNKEHIRLLFKQRLVDDVMLLDYNFDKLSQKVIFFQKYLYSKSYPAREPKIEKKNYTNISHFLIRSIDILVSTTALLFFLPLILLIAIIVKYESKGPAFYSSQRAGKGFKIFNFYKFRTMIVDADKKIEALNNLNVYIDGNKKVNFFKAKDDPRVTKIGAFLRKTSMDELPQLLNVLKGDMSIVGNRPLPLYEASSLTTNEWAERFMAPAGITGLWQITKRGKDEMSNEERILLDITYARNRSLKGDLKILIRTPAALFQKANF